jgi:hypothetical protein
VPAGYAGVLALVGCFGSGSQPAGSGTEVHPDSGVGFEAGARFDAGTQPDASSSDAGVPSSDSGPDASDAAGGGPVSPAAGTCVPTGSMAKARAFALSGSLPDGRFLVAGGGGGAAWTGAEVYDPTTGAFTPTGSMSAGRWGYPNQLVKLADGRLLVAGGADATCATALSTAEIYDPKSGEWSATGSMGTPRLNPVAVALSDGRALLRGGYSQLAGACGTVTSNALTSAEIYDPTSGTFQPTTDGATPRAAAASTLLADGTALIVTGEQYGNSPFNPTAEIYGASADGGTGFLWSGAVPGTAGYSFAFTLPSGKALVNSSYNGGTVSLFDPSSRTFAAGAADLISAGGGCGIQLKSGDVFLATGWSGGAHTPQTEVYQASTGTWALSGTMSVSRWVCAMAELPDGNVIVAGGTDASGTALATAEVCNPRAPLHGDL